MIVMQKSHIRSALLLISIILLITLPSPLIVQSQGDEVIRACTRDVGTSQKLTMLVIADSCEQGWTSIQWNVKGPQGDTGTPGADGKDGAPGPAWDPTLSFYPPLSDEPLISDKNETLPLRSHLACFLSRSGANHQIQACTCEVTGVKNGDWELNLLLDENVEGGRCSCRAMCMD